MSVAELSPVSRIWRRGWFSCPFPAAHGHARGPWGQQSKAATGRAGPGALLHAASCHPWRPGHARQEVGTPGGPGTRGKARSGRQGPGRQEGHGRGGLGGDGRQTRSPAAALGGTPGQSPPLLPAARSHPGCLSLGTLDEGFPRWASVSAFEGQGEDAQCLRLATRTEQDEAREHVLSPSLPRLTPTAGVAAGPGSHRPS